LESVAGHLIEFKTKKMGAQPASPPKTLAAEIRDSEAPFMASVNELIGRVMKLEYPRLRGYAIEGSTESVEVVVRLKCTFGGSPKLEIVSAPRVTPKPIHRVVQLDFFAA
jgi:hypothetical protein